MHPRTGISGLLAAALFATALGVTATQTTSPPASAPVAPVPVSDKIYNCIDGLERILPGDYYACRARYHFQRHHAGQAIAMLKEAAYWANKDAQYALGLIYLNGDVPDTPADRSLGIAWLALSAERKNAVYAKAYAIARSRSTPDELRQAVRLWRRMRLDYGDEIAGPRAMLHFDHAMKYMLTQSMSGNLQLPGYAPNPRDAVPVLKYLNTLADKDFEGLQGTVTVGPLTTGESLKGADAAHKVP